MDDAVEEGGCGSNDVSGETLASKEESIDANDGW